MMEKIKKFFWPNKGILEAFAVWTIFFVISYSLILSTNPAFKNIFENPVTVLTDVAVNLLVLYLFTCLSIWAYEKMKKK
jgi:predicted transporter